MSRGWLGLLALGTLLCPLSGHGMEAVLGLEYDDNPFETSGRRRGSWLNRFYLVADGRLMDKPWGNVRVRHQWGLKRFWQAEDSTSARGEVVASQLELGGVAQVHERALLVWGSELKIKHVEQISSEEGYLRGALRADLRGDLGRGFNGVLRYRLGGDSGRDEDLADVSLQEVGLQLDYGPSRRLQARVGLTWRWLDYDRLVLELGAERELVEGGQDQSDRWLELAAGVQVYRGMLADLNYTFLDNDSNSFGYGFRAHRLQLLLSRPIAYGVDGQFLLTAQRRRYRESLTETLPWEETEREEFAQNMLRLKLSRQLSDRYGLSCQYRYARNGSRQSEDSYRKNSYTLSLDISI